MEREYRSLDEIIDWIHSEAVVLNAIIHSNNNNLKIPSYEKMMKVINFLKENNFWRSHPYSLIIINNRNNNNDDKTVVKPNHQLYMKNIKDLWENNKEFNNEYEK
ncbi:unnamed protein product [Schistosoma mattheei]|uniref:Uncharacterized protein n=1 Tax=Schistosoma mattheei TaxID=31246 RepID=A0AA85BVS7_9TREM|nr:unnamed protein product [Schistosoma mattheei]